MLSRESAIVGREGGATRGVLVLVAVVVVVVSVILLRSAGRGDEVASSEPAIDTAAPAVTELEQPPAIAVAANQLFNLIDSARAIVMEIPELNSGAPASEARRVRGQWNAWSEGFLEQLDAIAGLIEEPPEDADPYAKLGHQRMLNAVEELRQLAQFESDTGVPPMYLRSRNLLVARNHVDSAGGFLEKVGIYF